MSATVRDAALEWYDVDGCVMPPEEDGTKAPIGLWKHFQSERPDHDQMRSWYGATAADCTRSGIGIITGRVSGNLILWDFDTWEHWEAFEAAAEALGLAEVLARIVAGYSERTPAPGMHLFTYCDEIGGNQKLARRLKRPEEMNHTDDKIKTLIETKEEGGFAVVAPSNGTVHPSGGAYELIAGSPATIATITPEERRQLLDLARTFDEMPVENRVEAPARSLGRAGTRPGDDFNERADWAEILEPRGWRHVYRRGVTGYWRRPGKDRGVSATTNHAGSGLLYVFSSSTPFEPLRGYGRFSAYALLEHAGDFAAAARTLASEGYGEPGTRAKETKNTKKTPTGGDSLVSFVSFAAPDYPVEALPAPFDEFVRAAAKAHAMPAEFVALPLLADAGAALGRTARIEIKRGWYEFASFWFALVAAPGAGKTPAAATAHRPLRALQRAALERFEEQLATHEQQLAEWTAAGEERGAKPVRPRLESYYSTDATTEALAEMLQASPGIALHRDELSGWVAGFDAYRGGRGGDRQNALSAWSSAPLKVDRKTKDSIVVDAPVITVAGGIQPDVLPDLAAEAGRQDGFLERMLWGWPNAKAARWTDDEISPELMAKTEAAFSELRPERGEGEWPLRTITLSSDARALWIRWHDENADQVEADAGMLAGVDAKMPAQAARLALLLHCLACRPNPTVRPLSAETMAAAIDLAEYHRAHARKVFAALGNSEAQDAIGLLARRVERLLVKAAEALPRTDLHAALGGHVRAEALDEALARLEAEGRAEAATDEPDDPARPGRRAERWRVRANETKETKESPPACENCGVILAAGETSCPDCDGGLGPGEHAI